jgi:arylsulfatase A-like enzyme
MRILSILILLFGASLHAAPPNVLFILVDDMRPDCIGAVGHPVVKTPTLDSLVKGGFRFHNAYCLGSNIGAVCTPSRNMILSGQSYFRGWKMNLAPGDGPNFADAMKQAGYITYRHGKKGNVARLLNARFDHNHALENDEKERSAGHPGKTITETTIEFLKQQKGEKPFFIFLEYEAPHDPRVGSKETLALYERDRIPLPKNFIPVHPFDNGEMLVRDERLAKWPRTESEIRKHLHDYYAVITGIDEQIGRVLATVKEKGLTENTIVIFAADSGLAIGSHGLMGKQNLYDHTMRTPLIFSGPSIPKGESKALVYLMDIFPTVCEWTGAKAPADLDGISFAPVLKGKSTTARETLFTAYANVQRAVRDERWKLIRYPQVDQTQLFDLQNDPDELKNLASDPESAKQIARLTKELEVWQKKLNDKQPLKVAKPRDPKFVPPKEKE